MPSASRWSRCASMPGRSPPYTWCTARWPSVTTGSSHAATSAHAAPLPRRAAGREAVREDLVERGVGEPGRRRRVGREPEVHGVGDGALVHAGAVDGAVAGRAAVEQEPVVRHRVAHDDVGTPPRLGVGRPVDDGGVEVRLAVAHRAHRDLRGGARVRDPQPDRHRLAELPAPASRRGARSRRGAARCAGSPSALHGPGGDAADDEALQELEQQHRRDGEDARRPMANGPQRRS